MWILEYLVIQSLDFSVNACSIFPEGISKHTFTPEYRILIRNESNIDPLSTFYDWALCRWSRFWSWSTLHMFLNCRKFDLFFCEEWVADIDETWLLWMIEIYCSYCVEISERLVFPINNASIAIDLLLSTTHCYRWTRKKILIRLKHVF